MSRLRSRIKQLLFLPLLTLLLCSAALAADLPYTLRLEWTVDEQTLFVEPVTVGKKNTYFFLPGVCPLDAMTLRLDGADSILIEDIAYSDGDTVDCSALIDQAVTVSLSDAASQQKITFMQGSTIPAMFFRVAQKDLDRMLQKKSNDLTEAASLLVIEADGSLSYADALTSMHTRGNSTRRQPKRPYQIKLARKTDFGGMGASKTWLLLANWFDVSLLRNQITLDLARETGIAFTPECRQTDVYLNGRYNGTYLLTEKIQISKERVNITNLEKATEALNDPDQTFKRAYHRKTALPLLSYFKIPNEPEDVTGGYILEIEKALSFEQNKENAGFRTDHGMFIIIKEPSQAGERAAQYIGNLINDLHTAACAKNGINPKTGTYYLDLIDGTSFAAKYLIEEISENFDAVAGSQFLYKDSDAADPRIHAGPAWDYDLSYGNKAKGTISPTKEDYVAQRNATEVNLYRMLAKHEDFQALLADQFRSTTLPALRVLTGAAPPAAGSRLISIDDYADAIAASANMNFTRWNTSVINDLYEKSGKNFPDAVTYLKSWLTQRTDFLVTKWGE